MQIGKILCIGSVWLAFNASLIMAGDPPAEAGYSLSSVVTPLCNEVSYFKNIDDLGHLRGTTLQIVSINQFHIGTDFNFEFTGDFNWGLDLYENYDYYFELSLVKPVYRSLSLNYQRIYSTFALEPINQLGFRLSLFSGS
jgi:hypothetical protein